MQINRLLFLFIAISLFVLGAQAQVKWTQSIKMTDDKNGVITFTANIDPGWHIFSNDMPDYGPIPLSIYWDKKDGVKLVGDLKPNKAPKSEYEEMWGMDVRYWEGAVSLTQKFTTTAPKYNLEGSIRYQACSDTGCTTGNDPFELSGTVSGKKTAQKGAQKKSQKKMAKGNQKAPKKTTKDSSRNPEKAVEEVTKAIQNIRIF